MLFAIFLQRYGILPILLLQGYGVLCSIFCYFQGYSHLVIPTVAIENCFSQISFDWFIRRMTEVLNSGIYLNFTVAMETKMADKIGIKQRSCHFDQI